MVDRKACVVKLIATVRDGIEYGEHIEGNGGDIFRVACEHGHEGIVAKRKDLPYASGRSKRWVKIRNPSSAPMKRVVGRDVLDP